MAVAGVDTAEVNATMQRLDKRRTTLHIRECPLLLRSRLTLPPVMVNQAIFAWGGCPITCPMLTGEVTACQHFLPHILQILI